MGLTRRPVSLLHFLRRLSNSKPLSLDDLSQVRLSGVVPSTRLIAIYLPPVESKLQTRGSRSAIPVSFPTFAAVFREKDRRNAGILPLLTAVIP
jgi:hypothetical protein